jgi:predicted GNAT superfamily acetyltransferase
VARRAPEPRSKEFHLRRLQKPEELRAVEEVQREAWGLEEEPPVPVPILRAIQDNGGQVLGAFADIYLAGFSFGFLGWDGKALFLYSHMTAVRPAYQNHHLGFRLKAFQREETLAQGLSEVRWTFDPLQSRNAFLNVRRLGGSPTKYLVHYYGQMGSVLNRGLETDRLLLHWELSTPRVLHRLEGQLPSADEDQHRWDQSEPVLLTEPGEKGLRIPTEVREPTSDHVRLEIPFDLASIREHEPEALPRWRGASREAFRLCLDLGFRVDDFAVLAREHEKRSVYFLERSPTAAAAS